MTQVSHTADESVIADMKHAVDEKDKLILEARKQQALLQKVTAERDVLKIGFDMREGSIKQIYKDLTDEQAAHKKLQEEFELLNQGFKLLSEKTNHTTVLRKRIQAGLLECTATNPDKEHVIACIQAALVGKPKPKKSAKVAKGKSGRNSQLISANSPKAEFQNGDKVCCTMTEERDNLDGVYVDGVARGAIGKIIRLYSRATSKQKSDWYEVQFDTVSQIVPFDVLVPVHEFKVGDRVQCIQKFQREFGHFVTPIVYGQSGTVDEINIANTAGGPTLTHVVFDDGIKQYVPAAGLEPLGTVAVEQKFKPGEQKFKPGDKVRCTMTEQDDSMGTARWVEGFAWGAAGEIVSSQDSFSQVDGEWYVVKFANNHTQTIHADVLDALAPKFKIGDMVTCTTTRREDNIFGVSTSAWGMTGEIFSCRNCDEKPGGFVYDVLFRKAPPNSTGFSQCVHESQLALVQPPVFLKKDAPPFKIGDTVRCIMTKPQQFKRIVQPEVWGQIGEIIGDAQVSNCAGASVLGCSPCYFVRFPGVTIAKSPGFDTQYVPPEALELVTLQDERRALVTALSGILKTQQAQAHEPTTYGVYPIQGTKAKRKTTPIRPAKGRPARKKGKVKT